MTHRQTPVFTALGAGLLAAVAAACGDSGATPTSGSTGNGSTPLKTPTAPGYERSSDGRLLRVGPSTCDEPPPGQCDVPADPKNPSRDSCRADADCKERPHGRCGVHIQHVMSSKNLDYPFCGCAYPCTSDADCGQGRACYCAAGGVGDCLSADCRSDADCSGGTCEVSGVDGRCRGDIGVHCKPPTAACHTDADCAPVDGKPRHCDYSTREWRCREAVCPQVGRPFIVDGVAHCAASSSRSDWSTDVSPADGLSGSDSARAAAHWLGAALMEHASVASFARFALELLALGAPSALVRRAHEAALDEIRHAELCFSIARRYGAPATGPAPLDAARATPSFDVGDVVRGIVLEGCVGESVAAADATLLAQLARDDDVRCALATIADDELRHAALAFDALAWIEQQFGAPATRAKTSALDDATSTLTCSEAPVRIDIVERHGVPSPHRARALRQRVIEGVVASLASSPRA